MCHVIGWKRNIFNFIVAMKKYYYILYFGQIKYFLVINVMDSRIKNIIYYFIKKLDSTILKFFNIILP